MLCSDEHGMECDVVVPSHVNSETSEMPYAAFWSSARGHGLLMSEAVDCNGTACRMPTIGCQPLTDVGDGFP